MIYKIEEIKTKTIFNYNNNGETIRLFPLNITEKSFFGLFKKEYKVFPSGSGIFNKSDRSLNYFIYILSNGKKLSFWKAEVITNHIIINNTFNINNLEKNV